MGKIKLSTKEFRYILFLKEQSGVLAKDCIVNDEKITYVVKEGKAGLAIGKNGKNVKKIKENVNKDVEVIEYNSDPIDFLKNIFKPAEIRESEIINDSGRKIVRMSPRTDKALVRSKLKKAKSLAKKYFDIEDIRLR